MGAVSVEDVAATVATRKARCEMARDARVRAVATREQAEAALRDASAALCAEAGVTAPEDAARVIEDLDRQIAAAAAQVDRCLARAQELGRA